MQFGIGKRLAGEFVGTWCLVFAGTGAIVIDDASHGAVSHVGVALTFGLIVFAMIAAVGDVSGAHLNPAVTTGFCLARRFPWGQLPAYLAAQCAGAMLASVSLQLLFPADEKLGGTFPAGPLLQSFALEVILTAILMFVILSVTVGAKEKGITAGLAIGGVVGLEALFAGPISGASMNPARSLGPAVVSFQFDTLWIYVVAPILGAAIAVPACWCAREQGCCSAACVERCGS